MQKAQPERRVSRGLIAVAILALFVLLASVTPSPYVIERPGPVVDTLGEIEVEGVAGPVIELAGVPTYETSGELNLLSVTMEGSPDQPTSWLSLIRPLLDPTQTLAHHSEVFAPGVTSEERDDFNAVLMGSSQTSAAVAALRELGENVPADLFISYVEESGPSAGSIVEGDQVLSAEGDAVSTVDELRDVVATVGAGNSLELVTLREGEQVTVTVTPEVPEGGSGPMLGVALAEDYELPFELEMSVEDIGGSSAGMIFALAIYDQLTEGELTSGLSVSGTGTVSSAGEVGQIGGLAQKMWGADRAGTDLLLFPVANCSDVPDRVPSDMALVPVETLAEAIAAIEDAAAGDEPPGMQRCRANS